jgi:uncharacterized membrane protein YpjA
MKRISKIALFGFILWTIPFIFSFFFFDKTGNLAIEESFFKSIMVFVGNLTGSILLLLYFKKYVGDYLKEAIIIGFSWFIINILLDVFILIPMAEMTFLSYCKEIGLRYLVLPTFSIVLGLLLKLKTA